MDLWIPGIAVFLIVIWLLANRFYFDREEREQNAAFRQCLEKQAQKRNGKVQESGEPTLLVPTENGNIELSFLLLNDETYREHTYARFKVQQFTDKHFVVLLKSKDLLLKPLLLGNRLELPDKQFNDDYVVTGNDAAFVASVLTQEICDKLRADSLQVSFGRRTDAAIFDREKGWLSVHTQFLRTGDEVFDALLDAAILLQERFEAFGKSSAVPQQHKFSKR